MVLVWRSPKKSCHYENVYNNCGELHLASLNVAHTAHEAENVELDGGDSVKAGEVVGTSTERALEVVAVGTENDSLGKDVGQKAGCIVASYVMGYVALALLMDLLCLLETLEVEGVLGPTVDVGYRANCGDMVNRMLVVVGLKWAPDEEDN